MLGRVSVVAIRTPLLRGELTPRQRRRGRRREHRSAPVRAQAGSTPGVKAAPGILPVRRPPARRRNPHPMSKRPTNTPARLTKAERKDQARRERAELQRKMARSKRNRTIAIAVAAVLVVTIGAYAITQSGGGDDSSSSASAATLLRQAAQAKTAAGCTAPKNVGPYQPQTQDQAHVDTSEAPPLSRYPSTPPASGPHNPTPLPAGLYDSPPPIDQAIHSLEHGGVIIWYAPDARSEE